MVRVFIPAPDEPADYERALTYCESSADHEGHASTLNNLAVLELELGD